MMSRAFLIMHGTLLNIHRALLTAPIVCHVEFCYVGLCHVTFAMLMMSLCCIGPCR